MKTLLNEYSALLGPEKMTLCRDSIYAGCVMKYNRGKDEEISCRKILFTLNEDGTVNDLMYDSPNYSVNPKPEENKKFYVSDIVKMEKFISEYWDKEYINYDELEQLFCYYLDKDSQFFDEDHRNLQVTLREYATLEILSKLGRRPRRSEKKEFEKFKPKTKTYHFR